jgi:protein-serine/threonine kinase
LNRNPHKRLGSGSKDAQEIKEHSFFKDVNWDDVINKRIPVPKPKIRKIEPNPVSIQSFLLEEEKNEELQKSNKHLT